MRQYSSNPSLFQKENLACFCGRQHRQDTQLPPQSSHGKSDNSFLSISSSAQRTSVKYSNTIQELQSPTKLAVFHRHHRAVLPGKRQTEPLARCLADLCTVPNRLNMPYSGLPLGVETQFPQLIVNSLNPSRNFSNRL